MPQRDFLLRQIETLGALLLDGIQAHLEEDGERATDSLQKARMLLGLMGPTGAYLVGFPEASERIRKIEDLLGSHGEA